MENATDTKVLNSKIKSEDFRDTNYFFTDKFKEEFKKLQLEGKIPPTTKLDRKEFD